MKVMHFIKPGIILSTAILLTGLAQAKSNVSLHSNCDAFPGIFRDTTRDGFSFCNRRLENSLIRIECFTFFPDLEESANRMVNNLLAAFQSKLDPSCHTTCYSYGQRTKHVSCKMEQV